MRKNRWIALVIVISLVLGTTLLPRNNRSLHVYEKDNLALNASEFGAEEWNATWGYQYMDVGYGIASGSDGIYFTGQSNISGDYKATLVKYTYGGTYLWNRTEGTNTLGWAVDVAANGFVYMTGEDDDDAFISRYSPTGIGMYFNEIWGNTSVGIEDYGMDIACASDGVYIVGSTESYGAGGYDAFIAKFNFDLDTLLWNKTWGTSEDEYGCAIDIATDGVYIMGDIGWLGSEQFIAKFDTSGNKLWDTTFAGFSYFGEQKNGLACVPGGVIVAGTVESTPRSIYISKYTSSGALQWSKTFGDGVNHYGFPVLSFDGTYIYATGFYATPAMAIDFLLVKFDTSGNQIWNLTYGHGSYNEQGMDVVATSDSIYAVGMTDAVNNGDVVIVKFTSEEERQGQIWEDPVFWTVIGIIGVVVVISIAAIVKRKRGKESY